MNEENAKVLTEHLERMGLKVVRTENRKVRRPLNELELAEIAKGMTEHVLKSKALEDEKKEVTKVLGDQQKREEAAAQALATKYDAKYDEEMDDCLVAVDYAEKSRKVFALKTGLLVATEPLEDKDLQVTMPLGDKAATAPAEPKAPVPEVIDIGYEGTKGEAPIEVEGVVIDDAVLEDAAKGDLERIEISTQIRLIEKKGSVFFITTAEKIVLFTENKDILGDAETARESRAYVKLAYLNNPEARNHEIASMEILEAAQDQETLAKDALDLPPELEAGDDPDGGDEPEDGEVPDPEEVW